MDKTNVQGNHIKLLCNHAVNLITAALGRIEMSEPVRAKNLLNEAAGVISEAGKHLDKLMKEAGVIPPETSPGTTPGNA